MVVGKGITFLCLFGMGDLSLLSGFSPNNGSPNPHLSLVSARAEWPAIRSGGIENLNALIFNAFLLQESIEKATLSDLILLAVRSVNTGEG